MTAEKHHDSGVAVAGEAERFSNLYPAASDALLLPVAPDAGGAASISIPPVVTQEHAEKDGSAPQPVPARRLREDESLWERWHLTAAAAFCWLFLALAIVVKHVIPAAPWAPTALFVLSYVAGGTFATQKALGDLVLERKVGVDF